MLRIFILQPFLGDFCNSGEPNPATQRTAHGRRRKCSCTTQLAPLWHAFTQLALVVLIFGTSWPLLKSGIQAGATPIWFAAARACCSTLSAFAFVGALGLLRWPTRRDWPIILSNGILQLALFFALGNLALRYIPAGRSAVLAYTTTLWLVPLEVLTGGSRLDLWRGLALSPDSVASPYC